MELKASIRPLCIFAKDLWPLGKVVPWCTDSFVLTGLYKNATTRLCLRLHHSYAMSHVCVCMSVWQVVHTHGRCSGQDEGAMGNVKRCRQVYVCISTAVKNRSVILYFCCSKLLDLFIYFLAHLTTTTHLSVSLAPMQNATKACAAQLIHFGILFVIFFICSVVSLASASLLFLFFLWLSFLC